MTDIKALKALAKKQLHYYAEDEGICFSCGEDVYYFEGLEETETCNLCAQEWRDNEAHPATILSLLKIIEVQREALKEIDDGGYRGPAYRSPLDVAASALEVVDKILRGDE